MKIFFRFTFAVLLLLSLPIHAQDGSPSPYSFYGLGDTSFRGTTENLAMGGIRVYADSIHYNINNPAALSRLKFVNLNLGLANNFINMSDQSKSGWFSSHNMSYFSLGLPVGKKIGIGLGLVPVNSSGFQIYEKDDLGTYTFKGDGGNSRIFLAAAYQLTKGLSIGLEYQYYFGFLDHENYWIPTDLYTYTKENNDIDFTGNSFKFSSLYRYSFKNHHYLNVSADFRMSADFKAHYKSHTQLITPTPSGNETVELFNRLEKDATIKFPASFNAGIGYGKQNQWFMGVEYDQQTMQDFKNPFFDPTYVKYQNATTYKIGGFYTPQYNSITKYWKRITYRVGGYYKNTGMLLYDTPITDFGITFGFSLPAIKGISNLNLGVELGQRGKITDRLVKEQYVNLHIGLSLNDRWFVKHKIN